MTFAQRLRRRPEEQPRPEVRESTSDRDRDGQIPRSIRRTQPDREFELQIKAK